MKDMTAEQIRALATGPVQKDVCEWALDAAISYQEEQLLPDVLDDGEQPISLADDMIFRLREQLAGMDPEDDQHNDWVRDYRAARVLADKIEKAIS